MIIWGVISVAATLAIILKSRIENLLAGTIIGMSALVYGFSRINSPDIGVGIVCAICLGSFLYWLVSIINGKSDAKKNTLTVGLVYFVVSSLFFITFCKGLNAAGSPDSIYWIRLVKGAYYDKTYWIELNNTAHPQFIAVWSYIAMKTWKNWSDTLLIASNDILLVSYFLPFFSILYYQTSKKEVFDKKYYLLCFLLAVCIFIIPYFSDYNEFAIYGADIVMAVSIGTGIVLFVYGSVNNKREFFYLSLVYFLSTIMTKRIAIVLVAVVLVCIFFILLLKNEYIIIANYVIVLGGYYILIKGNDKYVLALLGSVICAYFIKKCLEKKKNLLYFFLFVGIVATIFMFLGIKRYTYADLLDHNLIAISYVKMIIIGGMWYHIGDLIKISIGLYIFTNIIAMVVLSRQYKLSETEVIAFYGIIGFIIIYLALMFYLYMTQISNATGQYFQEGLLGVPRYMVIVPIILSCYWIGIIISRVNTKAMMVFVFLVMMLSHIKGLSKFMLIGEERISYNDISDTIVDIDKDDKIGFIDMGMINHYSGFYLDMFYRADVVNVDELSYTYRNANEGAILSCSELEKIIDGCSYLYIYNVDEEFYSRYGELFASNEGADRERVIYVLDQASKKYKVAKGL